jgi:hypothetical protein
MADVAGVFATLGGCIVALTWLVASVACGSIRMTCIGIFMAVLCVAVMSGIPEQLKARVTLATREKEYLRVIANTSASADTPTYADHGERILFDTEVGNLKVGFLFGNPMLNDGAIVYDPAGDIDRPGRKHPYPLFGGSLVSVSHLRGPWYYCSLELD